LEEHLALHLALDGQLGLLFIVPLVAVAVAVAAVAAVHTSQLQRSNLLGYVTLVRGDVSLVPLSLI
jgi:hypothetical protein